MRETNKERQLNEIYSQLLDHLRTKIDSNLFDTMFGDNSFELKSLDGNKAIFVTETSSNAAILKVTVKDDIERILSDILESDIEVEITDKISFAKKNKIIEENHYSFFQNSYLQKQYTFENFVIGSYNRDAFLAAHLAVDNPGRSNPIFLYSKSGLGKTHLLQAIGNAYQNSHPEANVLYITSDDFITEFVKFALGNKDSESLKEFFSTIDLLLVDDIQFLSNKEGSQVMFFNVFNLLVSHGKQIVLTSDRSPNELKGLPDRLITRFAGGLSISISNPNKDTLVEILKMKIKNSGLDISIFDDDVLSYLADNYGKNVRELEGSYTNLLFAVTTHKPTGKINLEFTKSVFEADEVRKAKAGKVDPSFIITMVAEYYNMTEAQLKSKVRTSQIALARQIAMYLCRSQLNTPYQEIGRQFGKDHATVMSNCEKIQNEMKHDATLVKVIDDFKEKIKNHK